MKQLQNESGVISLEACIALPIFIFLMMFVYGFMVLFTGQNTVSHALLQTSESLSLDSYALERIGTGEITESADVFAVLYSSAWTSGDDFASVEKWYEDEDKVVAAVKKRFVAFLADGDTAQADAVLAHAGIKGGVDSIDFTASKVENGTLTITITFEQEFLYNFQGLASFPKTMTVKAQMWSL